ncbi:hypothetical protein PoB_001698500 [Plakobranchus ocellatus]|uniref:Uncharacterized protein n=1 Tax=Plakobranchus ocellatus TaxID=259542 RepID=A0AAV3Z5Q3_9GAST|nr:hypothetical protein PoB_001698500 [Plakobranchus ocellatus]
MRHRQVMRLCRQRVLMLWKTMTGVRAVMPVSEVLLELGGLGQQGDSERPEGCGERDGLVMEYVDDQLKINPGRSSEGALQVTTSGELYPETNKVHA